MSTRLIEPGQIEPAAGALPELRPPTRGVFAERARRLVQLADGHPLGDYLRFAAGLARNQQTLLEGMRGVPGPDADLLDRCREYAMPPLAPAGWSWNPVWLAAARDLAEAMRPLSPEAAWPALDRIEAADDAWLEAQADRLLAGRRDGLDLACAPVIGAALQVYWTHLAGQLRPEDVARPEHPNLCPVCGSHPVASVVRIGGAENGLRYLHCALCATEWHVVRAKCSNCDNSRGVVYYNVEGALKAFTGPSQERLGPLGGRPGTSGRAGGAVNPISPAIRAEACPECRTYLKVVHQDKDPNVDPAADDLASLALDLLVGEQGFDKSGMNFLMIHGQGEG